MIELLLLLTLSLPPLQPPIYVVPGQCPTWAICSCVSIKFVDGKRKCTKEKIIGYKGIE